MVSSQTARLSEANAALSSALVIDSFVPEGAIDPVYFEDTYYLGAGDRGYRVLAQALQKTHRIAVGTFTWRGKTAPIAIRVHQHGLLLQRLYFTDEVHNAAEIDQGADPKIRDQEWTLAERLISELSETEFHPEKYEDEYRQRLLKAIEQKIAGQEIQRVEVETRPPTTDLVATLQASLGRKELAKVCPRKTKPESGAPVQGTTIMSFTSLVLLWRTVKPSRLRHADRFP
jgi:DNA end-binding protein Ku